jgi:hypothetical protein
MQKVVPTRKRQKEKKGFKGDSAFTESQERVHFNSFPGILCAFFNETMKKMTLLQK